MSAKTHRTKADSSQVEAWYQEAVKQHTAPKIPEGAITLKQFMKDTGLKRSTAHSILQGKVERGEIKCTKVGKANHYHE